MTVLEQYNCLEEIEKNFNVEYIQNANDFYKYVNFLNEKKNSHYKSLYRGVCSPKFKMFSSAQRFYHDNEFDELTYPMFLKKLYEVSPEIDNGSLLKMYNESKNSNYSRYVDTDNCVLQDPTFIEYNPIWVFHTLQHLTSCSPFIDFSVDFSIALYFASLQLFTCENCISKTEIDNYIVIISFDETSDLINKKNLACSNLYKSLTNSSVK